MARYRLIIKRSAAGELEKIGSKKDRQRLVALIQRLAENPRPPGVEKLSGTSNKYRLRSGNFRVLYQIEDDLLVVHVIKVADRKDAYRRGV